VRLSQPCYRGCPISVGTYYSYYRLCPSLLAHAQLDSPPHPPHASLALQSVSLSAQVHTRPVSVVGVVTQSGGGGSSVVYLNDLGAAHPLLCLTTVTTESEGPVDIRRNTVEVLIRAAPQLKCSGIVGHIEANGTDPSDSRRGHGPPNLATRHV